MQEPNSETGEDDIVPSVDLSAASTRRQKVERAVKQWTGQLVDIGSRNNLLYFKHLRAGTLNLSDANDGAVADLLEGRAVRLAHLFADPDQRKDAARRARAIRAKAKENFEERGLETLQVGVGMASWIDATTAATPAAPVLLYGAILEARGSAAEEFDLTLTEPEINPTLMHILKTEHKVSIAGDELLDLIEESTDPQPLFDRLQKLADRVLGFAIHPQVVVGNFSYAKLPMVNDLESALEELVASELIAAIAGDEGARTLVRETHPEIDPGLPDRLPPGDEFLVLDADSSQSYVINAAVHGADLVVEGPPGTGKSQTIANLIATLSARGKSVLFVAEKRAAIDAVLKRLTAIGLHDLVLDLHDGAGSRRKLAADIARSLDEASKILKPDLRSEHRVLVDRRDQLSSRATALHARRDPWRQSIYAAQAACLGTPVPYRTEIRLAGEALRALDEDAFATAKANLEQYAALGGLTLTGEGNPWAPALEASAVVTSDQVQAALRGTASLATETLPGASARLERMLLETGLPRPNSIDGWRTVFELLDNVKSTLEAVDPSVFAEDLEELTEMLAPATRGVISRAFKRIADGNYRRGLKRIRGYGVGRKIKPKEAVQLVTAARSQSKTWTSLSTDGGRPRLPADLAGVEGAYEQLGEELRAVGAFAGMTRLEDMSEADLDTYLKDLLREQATLFKLPHLVSLRTSLMGLGLGPIIEEAGRRGLTPEGAVKCLSYCWFSSIMEAVSTEDPLIGAFDGNYHGRVADEFRDRDRAHIASTPHRIKRAVAERITSSMDLHRNEAAVIQQQARLKRKHLPTRDLFQVAPTLLTAIKPCWAMSPLVVSQLLPAKACFDVVVFDEASQITPADAVGALLRARQAIVAGDPHQLPPTAFFSATTSQDEGPEEDLEGPPALTSGMESVLDVMSALLPQPRGTRTLSWHYRSRDERLIAFSNAQPTLYNWSLVTFPGVLGGEALRHVLVDDVARVPGDEASNAAEVERVVDLIIEHATQNPEASLGVIAMGIKHAERINEALRRRRPSHPELDEFFSEARSESLFIKNLERVQGDERDSIILTIGYSKSADGRMMYRFGPLNTQGGERRLNVAVTRARSRMIVVSSFASRDMDPNRLNAEGAKLLRSYLAYTESGGEDLGSVTREKQPLNPFERDVEAHLIKAGIPLVPQLGASGYWIDFAAQHPKRPGQMVLAIEADGASYHSSHTARDRDRLRQAHLENLGWSFHRIWSTDWFYRREQEVEKAVAAYQAAVSRADAGPKSPDPVTAPKIESVAAGQRRSGHRPNLSPGMPIHAYAFADLVQLIIWIESDTRLRTEDQLIAEAMTELGFKRKGPKILDALKKAITAARA